MGVLDMSFRFFKKLFMNSLALPEIMNNVEWCNYLSHHSTLKIEIS